MFLHSCLTGVVYILEEVEKNVNFSYRLLSKSSRSVETSCQLTKVYSTPSLPYILSSFSPPHSPIYQKKFKSSQPSYKSVFLSVSGVRQGMNGPQERDKNVDCAEDLPKRENIRGEIQCVKRNGGDWWLQGFGAVVLRSSFSSQLSIRSQILSNNMLSFLFSYLYRLLRWMGKLREVLLYLQ